MSAPARQIRNEVTVRGYRPFEGQPEADGKIIIEGYFPDEKLGVQSGESYKEWEKRSAEKFIRDAEAIYEVLANNLPDGTLHQLLIRMLQGKLNLFVVKE